MSRAKAKQFRRKLFTGLTLAFIVVAITGIYLAHHTVGVLQPVGPVAAGERRILIVAFLLMLLIVIPVFGLLGFIAWRYRETNKKPTKYQPNWDHSPILETIWWLIPTALITAIAIITWHGTFKYDPYRPLASKAAAMTVQVVAGNGWWLFLYPHEGVASLNKLMLPVGRPVSFEMTADAPMNSFWIPQLGGQMYVMPGMVSQLHLEADKMGSYYGSSANISGHDFASMHFQTVVQSQHSFTSWAKQTRVRSSCLDKDSYDDIQPETLVNKHLDFLADPALFGQIVDKYMHSMPGMDDGMMMHNGPAVTDVRTCRA